MANNLNYGTFSHTHNFRESRTAKFNHRTKVFFNLNSVPKFTWAHFQQHFPSKVLPALNSPPPQPNHVLKTTLSPPPFKFQGNSFQRYSWSPRMPWLKNLVIWEAMFPPIYTNTKTRVCLPNSWANFKSFLKINSLLLIPTIVT